MYGWFLQFVAKPCSILISTLPTEVLTAQSDPLKPISRECDPDLAKNILQFPPILSDSTDLLLKSLKLENLWQNRQQSAQWFFSNFQSLSPSLFQSKNLYCAEIHRNREFYRTHDVRPPFTYASLIRQVQIRSAQVPKDICIF